MNAQADPNSFTTQPISQKKTLSRPKRLLRLILSTMDPRAWLHLFKMLNYYNYTHVAQRRQLTIGNGSAISPNVSFSNADQIFIGPASHLGTGCILWAGRSAGTITAGKNLLLGPNVMMTTTGYRFNDGAPVTAQLMDEAPITIGEDVWVGANAVILPGTTIGDGAIIAAAAVVRGNVPDAAIMAGVPAKNVGVRTLS